MRKLFTGDCHSDSVFQIVDPTQFIESDFEAEVVKALRCLQPDYLCGVFSGAFVLEGERRIADLALIHKNLSHWFVVEVELAGHSLEHHVLPQVRCFRYGEPDTSCASSLVRAFEELNQQQAESLLRHVPRYVAVIGNLPDPEWAAAFRGLGVQHLTVFVYQDRKGRTAHEIEGRLVVSTENLGFARFSAVDNCLRIPRGCGLPSGTIQIVDQFGNPGEWVVEENEGGILWIRKVYGPALIPHETYVQIMRSVEGQISIKV